MTFKQMVGDVERKTKGSPWRRFRDWLTEKRRLRAALVAASEERQRQVALVQEQLRESDAALKALREASEEELGRLRFERAKAVRAKAPHVVKIAERAMSKEDLLAELAVDDENTLWRAVHQVLNDAIDLAVDAAAAPPVPHPSTGVVLVTPDVRTFHAGGVDHLRELQRRLLDLQREGRAAEKGEAEEAE